MCDGNRKSVIIIVRLSDKLCVCVSFHQKCVINSRAISTPLLFVRPPILSQFVRFHILITPDFFFLPNVHTGVFSSSLN